MSPLIRFWNNLTELQAAAVIAALILTIGAIVEYWYKLKLLASLLLKWILRKSTPFDRCVFKRLLLHSIGPILVVLGIAGEVLFEGRAVVVEDRQEEEARKIVGSLKEQAKEADEEGKKAIADSSTALSQAKDALGKAGKAQESLGKAEAEANNAEVASSNALKLARDAQKEADSFERDIASAKTLATDAESHLAEATKSANILTAKLERLTTPRRLPHSAPVVAPLKTFRGTEYVFIGTCQDEECFVLVSDIDELLKLAGWKRIKGPPMTIGISQIDIKDDKEFAVNVSVSTGIGIYIETPNGFESVKGLPDDQQAEHFRAAIALNRVLSSNVSPSENTGKLVGVKRGTSMAVQIDVGRKPL